MIEGYVFSELDALAIEKQNLSDKPDDQKWQTMPYVAADIKGTLLLAGETSYPADITLRAGLSGWHKIYVATINMNSANYFMLRLSSDAGFTGIRSTAKGHLHRWSTTEYAEEFLWKCADLTSEDIIIHKPESFFLNACTLAWIRCVPMSEKDVDEYKSNSSLLNIHAHVDCDPTWEDGVDSNEALLARIFPMPNTSISECSLEISLDYDTPECSPPIPVFARDISWYNSNRAFTKIKDHAYHKRVDFLHSHGIKAYVANRMSVAEFTTPYCNPYMTEKNFPSEHPQYYCTMRDGSRVEVCSYAFPEVRKYATDLLLSHIGYGFDGVTLIFHRGLHIGFDQPVISEFCEKYPGIDPFTLPVTDKRLNGVFCKFMTEFMQGLRNALDAVSDRHIEICVIIDYSPESSRNFGLDVEEWARLGLVDKVMQGIMETFEDIEGCTDGSGLIDLEKYKEKNKVEPIIKRYHKTDLEKTVKGALEYQRICSRHEVKFFATMPWPHSVEPKEYIAYKNALGEIGIRDFISWNTNHLIYDLPEFHAMVLGDNENCDDSLSVNHYRVLRLGENNMSYFNRNWRG